ncbi:uncharacterized protein G2W53_001945 [Senna tora]|uniref:Uncharacterized protein n=1 Tax=Senna tora TaxID=362788 RepID=A0A835CLZ3_9FABA|nr:uncharacterized protein G2W53_001945 [Senna tora]
MTIYAGVTADAGENFVVRTSHDLAAHQEKLGSKNR